VVGEIARFADPVDVDSQHLDRLGGDAQALGLRGQRV
jgi:hypothetical protein